ncbi:ATP-binding protein [Kordiimonas sp.]|uniref:ATP-binding protein n=1 Tax=Kordiimonas sp. TaxID=1970157 RepID=UPI003A9316AC
MTDINHLAEHAPTCSDTERRDLLASIQRQEQQLRVLNSFAVSLMQITSAEELAWYVAKEVVGKLGFVDCVFYEVDSARGVLVQRAAIGDKNPEGRIILNPLEVALGQGITGTVAASEKPLLIPDVRDNELYLSDIVEPGSELCVPLFYGDDILGVIDCEDPRVGHFTQEHLDILMAVASLASAKMAECKTLSQLQENAKILKRVREAVIVCDLAGRLTECNEGAALLFGGQRDVLVGSRITSLMAYERSWRSDKTSILEGIRNVGEWRGYLDMKGANAEVLTVDASLTTIADTKGNVTRIVGVARDVTDLLRAEKAILEKNEALESKQVELEQALVAGEEARRANRAKDAFLANTSHELRTPLAGVIGMIGLLEDTSLSDEQQQLVETANVSAHTLLTIIDDILDLAKMEAGTLSLRETDFNPVELIEKAAATLRPAASAKSLALNVVAAGDAPAAVRGDGSRIRQILFNLVGNAIKFTERGQIDVFLSFERDTEGLHFLMEVRDTGAGFPNSEREKIFGRFEQLDGSATKKVSGTGLGLSISRELAQMMGGTLRASGRPGQGASFYLAVPLQEPLREAALPLPREVDKTSERAENRQLKVLVAEDNAINQLLIEKILEQYGWDLAMVSNGREATCMLDERDFDLVLMDIRMPVLDGVEATKLIRARDDDRADIPIVALTANTMEEDKQSYLKAGMNGVVGKPVDRTVLMSTITDVLNRTGKNVARA